MEGDQVIYSIFLIFTGAALLATLALYARQSMLVAYILLGVLLGPWGGALVTDVALLRDMSHIGIIFLLFLLGLHLPPQKLVRMFREAALVTLGSSLVSALLGFLVGSAFGFSATESAWIGIAIMFSSTIIGLKLLPTTVLHHRHAGEIVISVLLLQDLIAIVALLLLHGFARHALHVADFLLLVVSLPALILVAFLVERYVLMPLFQRFDRIQEFIFLIAIGWCLGIAQLATWLGLSYEIGAFIAGVAIATGPLSLFIAESLRPLRDFFLIVFFFALGASFDLAQLRQVVLPALALSAAVLFIKPFTFQWLLRWHKEAKDMAWEIGVRLGQTSEFALLIAFLALQTGVIGERASYLIQLATLITFTASSYYIVARFPTPIATKDSLRRD